MNPIWMLFIGFVVGSLCASIIGAVRAYRGQREFAHFILVLLRCGNAKRAMDVCERVLE